MAISTDDRARLEADEELRQRQVRQAEELLFSGPPTAGFVKGLFRGTFAARALFPYPEIPAADRPEVDAAVAAVRRFADERIDAAAIDRAAEIPREVISGLADLGVLGMTAPKAYGGRGFSQLAYCQVMEVLGGHDASTGVFVNAHHSIGIRALLLFGTEEQKTRWLPPLARGEQLAAFALTETEAGSDAANVQTTATPSPDGSHYILNGTKRWITNGGIADVLTVMARTPDPAGGESRITAFLVTPDLPGFEVVEARMEKCGIRGTATGRLAFHDMPVPASNILGPLGKGLRVALTVLDFGRTTFGASCTGVANRCLEAAVAHALRRRQFGRNLAQIELIQKKLAYLAAVAYAMEATTAQTAALIDRGGDDYMLETAILKVFATEELWQAVYETLQVHGGLGYFTDQPYERMMRDARINTIGEGANEVLKAFIALVGMRDVGEGFRATLDDVKRPAKALPALWQFGYDHAARWAGFPERPDLAQPLLAERDALLRRVKRFGWTIERSLMHHREAILEKQLVQERIADAAIALYTSACTLARLDAQHRAGTGAGAELDAGRLYLAMARRRFDTAVRGLADNDDAQLLQTARAVIGAAEGG